MSGQKTEIRGQRVFITGAARGIGRAIAEALLSEGAKVFFCDVNEITGRATEADLKNQYGPENVRFAVCDITNVQQYKAVFQSAVSSLGAVDVCINNAGILGEVHWEKMVAVNQVALIRGSQMALEHMRRDLGGHGGVIINTSSQKGFESMPLHPVYTATKHAVLGFTLSMAGDEKMKEMGVRWICLCPGPTDTEILSESDKQFLSQLETISSPAHVGKMVVQLVQDNDNNGAIARVTADSMTYKRRVIVDKDGKSNPVFVDDPLPSVKPKAKE